MAAVSEMVACQTVTVTGVALPAMCVRIDDTVGVQLRDARHWGKTFEEYHFLISKLVSGSNSRAANNVENGLLVEINGESVARADFNEVQRLMEEARNSDFVILKFIPFQLIQPYILSARGGALPSPPPPQFVLLDVLHDGNCFFYAAQQSVHSGRNASSLGPQSAAAQRLLVWKHFNAWWSRLPVSTRQKVWASYLKTYPFESPGVDVTKETYWLTPFQPVTEYQVRVWSDVMRIKVVIYTFYSKGSWLRLKSKRLITLADLHEAGRVNRMVIGPRYSQTIYLLHVSDREHGFEHYASLIPQPPSS